MKAVIGDAAMVFGMIFMSFGILGLYRFKKFYSRALSASTIDTVGFISIMVGVIIKRGIDFFSLKVFLIMIIVMIINPVATHAIVRSAYNSGFREK